MSVGKNCKSLELWLLLSEMKSHLEQWSNKI